MDAEIFHNGNNITSSVIRYDREHKICTGIGLIELEVDYSLSGNFDPWDSIEIYEGGSLEGGYYVSTISEGQPNATIIINGQDESKKLTDYFISDSYLIDYPSYTSFWIGYFLDEIGVNYSFNTDDPGSLLSNNTSLGLTSAYDQILLLLQMSGWYITFSANGTAIIGKLTKDFASVRASIDSSTIQDVKVISSDRMLRNRVVVWGHGDPLSSRWVFADVYRKTPWDYDKDDRRTIVISNSNIRTVANAFLLANRALSEFARITVEKHFVVDGITGVMVGDVIRARTRITYGKGLVTTFGTSMSKDGLITNIVLDERCPRLFGFYDLGGFVYVGTYGSGVWRKHINPNWSGGGSGLLGFAGGVINASGWNNYSSGLMDLNVTDLHINAGVLSCVTSTGHMYYSIEDESPWTQIPLSGLQVIYSGVPIEETVYSGVMARACIIDRDTNYLRYAIDTRSGINYGDFLMETDSLNPENYTPFSYETYSGYLASSGNLPSGVMRSWILNVNPYSGYVISQHSINVSGNYDWYVYDIENDGLNDYIEAMTLGSGSMPQGISTGAFEGANYGANFGSIGDLNTKGVSINDDERMNTFMAYSGWPDPLLQTLDTSSVSTISTNHIINSDEHIALYDDLPAKPAYAAYTDVYTPPNPNRRDLKVAKFNYDDDGNIVNDLYTATSDDHTINGTDILKIDRINDTQFNFIGVTGFTASSVTGSIYNNKFDILADTVISTPIIENVDLVDLVLLHFPVSYRWNYDTKIIGDYLYHVRAVGNSSGAFDGVGFALWFFKINLLSGGLTKIKIFEAIGTGYTEGFTSYGSPYPVIFQNGYNDIKIICPYLQRDHGAQTSLLDPATNLHHYYLRRFSYPTDVGMGSDQLVLDWGDVYGEISYNPSSWDLLFFYHQNDTPGGYVGFKAGNFNRDRSYFRYAIGDDSEISDSVDVICDFGDNIAITHGKGSDTLYSYDKIYNIRGDPSRAVCKKLDGTFTFSNPLTGEEVSPIITQPGITLMEHLGATDSFNKDHFFQALVASGVFSGTNSDSYETVTLNSSNSVTRRSDVASSSWVNHQIFGNFRVSMSPSGTRTITYAVPNPAYGKFPLYSLLQRTEDDFNVVKSGIYRERIDISNYAPIVTMDRRISSLETYFISADGQVLQTINPSISGFNLDDTQASGSLFTLGLTADDFRYADFEDVAESGSTRKLMVVFSGGIGGVDLYTLENFSGIYPSNSGIMNRIEISNYSFPDQYIFTSVNQYSGAGGDWGFFEKIPSGVFVDYSSGYPQARTTIIRLDDKL